MITWTIYTLDFEKNIMQICEKLYLIYKIEKFLKET